MIRIEVTYCDNKIKELLVEGHSNSAEKGKDLICAAVSSIVIGGANAIENPKCYAFTQHDGLFHIVEKTIASDHDYQTLKTIVIQLKTIVESYPRYVEIIEKGK